jgi:hypothetical protein
MQVATQLNQTQQTTQSTQQTSPITLSSFSSVQSKGSFDGFSGNKEKFALIVRWVAQPDSNRVGYRLEISGGGQTITPPCDLLVAACKPAYTEGGTSFSLDLYDPQIDVYKFTNLMSESTRYSFKVFPLGVKDAKGNPTIGSGVQGSGLTPGAPGPAMPSFSVTGGSKNISFTWIGWQTNGAVNSYSTIIVTIGGVGASVRQFTMDSPGTRNFQANPGEYLISAIGIAPSGRQGPIANAVLVQVSK